MSVYCTVRPRRNGVIAVLYEYCILVSPPEHPSLFLKHCLGHAFTVVRLAFVIACGSDPGAGAGAGAGPSGQVQVQVPGSVLYSTVDDWATGYSLFPTNYCHYSYSVQRHQSSCMLPGERRPNTRLPIHCSSRPCLPSPSPLPHHYSLLVLTAQLGTSPISLIQLDSLSAT